MNTTTKPVREVPDPHHDSFCRWKFENGVLLHRSVGQSQWTIVKRVSFTPERFLAIATLLTSAEGTSGSFAMLNALDCLDELERDLSAGEHNSWRRARLAGIRAYILGAPAEGA